MRVESLHMSGLRSHRAPGTTVEFGDKPLVAVVGPTGAGKSSLLEAVCFALFGEATFGGHAFADLASDGHAEMTVRMVFALGDTRYRLVRTVAPSRKGDYTTREVWLRQIDADDRDLSHHDGRRKVDNEIRRLLGGIDREQFCQAVLLAQNRYGELLEADDTTRDKLLDILLGLTALGDARTGARKALKVAQDHLVRLEYQRGLLDADPAARIVELEARAQTLELLAGRADDLCVLLQERVDERSTLLGDADRLAKLAQLRYGSDDGLERLDQLAESLSTAATDQGRLTELLAPARGRRTKSAADATAAEETVRKLEAERGSPTLHAATRATHDHLAGSLAELPGRLEAVAHAEARAHETTGRLDECTEAAAATNAERETAQTAFDLAADEARNAADASTARDGHLGQLAAASQRAVDALGAVTPALSTALEAAQTAAAAAEALTGAEAARAQAEVALTDAQREHAAAAAAEGCSVGDDCPVCNVPLGADWVPPVATDLEGVRAAAEAARGRERNAARERERASAAVRPTGETINRLLGEARTALDALTSPAAACELDVPEAVASAAVPADLDDVDVPVSPEQADAARRCLDEIVVELERWSAQCAASGNPLVPTAHAKKAHRDAVEARLEETQKAARVNDQALVTTREEAATAAAQLEAARVALADTRTRIDDARTGIEPRWRELLDDAPDDHALAEALKAAGNRLTADEAAVTQARDGASDARQEATVAAQAVTALESDWERLVERPRAQAVDVLAALHATVAELAETLAVDAPEPPTADGSCADLAAGARRLVAEATALASVTMARVEELRTRAGELARQAVELLDSLAAEAAEALAADPDADSGGGSDADLATAGLVADGGAVSAQTIQAVASWAGVARGTLTAVRTEVTQMTAQRDRAASLDEQIVKVRVWSGELSAAGDILHKSRFPAWARAQRVAELVEQASGLLAGMTGGRYRFDERLRIVDEVAGSTRRAITLSGGEKFEAALALALAVSEIAGRSGVRFDTLFLDEGFAGLDQSNLNSTLDILEREIEMGRSIVLITHIGAVADRIRDVLLIEPDDAAGSKVRWLADEQRAELGADLDLVET